MFFVTCFECISLQFATLNEANLPLVAISLWEFTVLALLDILELEIARDPSIARDPTAELCPRRFRRKRWASLDSHLERFTRARKSNRKCMIYYGRRLSREVFVVNADK